MAPGIHFTQSHKPYACFSCRKSFKRPVAVVSQGPRLPGPVKLVPYRCPDCGREAHYMGRDFKAPKLSDRKAWKAVEAFIRSGRVYVAGNQMPREVRAVTSQFNEARNLMAALKGSAFTAADLQSMPSDYHPRRAFIARIKASKS